MTRPRFDLMTITETIAAVIILIGIITGAFVVYAIRNDEREDSEHVERESYR